MQSSQIKNQLKPSVIGVDLGSFFTKVSAVDKGAVDIITNQANLRQTPSVVGYGNNERLVGEAGSVKIKSNISNTVVSPQRYLGSQFNDKIREEGKNSPCVPREENQQIFFSVNCQGNHKTLVPEQVTAALLTNVNKIVQINKLNSKFIAYSVPNYYTQRQRQALINAINTARNSMNHNYGYQLVNESTAVGMDYGYYKRNDFSQKEEEGRNVVFIDFGHSKLSCYIIRFTKNYQKVIYQLHERDIGCRNLDRLVLDYYSEMFEKKFPNMELKVSESKRATLKLLQNIQKQRKILTGISENDCSIDCLLQDNDFSYTITRNQFQQVCLPVIDRISSFFSQVKTKIFENKINCHSIELIGGGSRIPFFVKKVHEIFEIQPSRTLNSSESVARGAGLCAAMPSGIFRMQHYHTVEMSATGIKTKISFDTEDISSEESIVDVIEYGMSLFNKNTKILQLKNKKAKIEILQKSKDQELQRIICSFMIEPNESENQQRNVALLINFDDNLVFSQAQCLEGQEGDKTIALVDLHVNKKYNKQQLQVFCQKERQQILKDIKIIQNYEAKNNCEAKIYQLKEKISQISSNVMFKQFINPAHQEQCRKYFNDIQQSFSSETNFEQVLNNCKNKVAQLYTITQQTKKKYQTVEQSLKKLKAFLQDIISGKAKGIRYYPSEVLKKVQQWINQINSEVKSKPKFQGHIITLEQVQEVEEKLKKDIEQYQNQMIKQKKQAEERERQQFRPTQSAFGRSPFDNSFGFGPRDNNGHDYPKRRNNGGKSFFPGFSGFF